MEKNPEMTISEALKEKIIKSVIFHLATCQFFDELRLMELKKLPQYQLSASDVEYLNQHQRYLNYMKANDIFSELGTPSDPPPDFVAKIPMRPLTFGVDGILRFRKVMSKKMVTRTRTVEKKVFLWFKKKVEEEYEEEKTEFYYVPIIADDVFELCRDIVKKLTEIGYKDPKVSFLELTYSTYSGFRRFFSHLVMWREIQNNKIDDNHKNYLSFGSINKVGDELYEITENEFRSDSGGTAYVTMEIQADLENKSPSAVLQYFQDIRSLAWKYYQENYGEIVF